MDFFLVNQLKDFLGRLDTLLDPEIFGDVPSEAKTTIVMAAESLCEDGKFSAMELFDIFIAGAPALDRIVHAQMYYKFIDFAEVV